MPSSPQTVATTNVFDYVKDSANNPLRNQTVGITLQYGGAIAITPPVFILNTEVLLLTDQNGFWQANLVPNGNLTPSGTTYVVEINGQIQYEIVVPASGPVQSSTIIVNQPLVLTPAPQTITGPVTVSGNETVTGNLTVQGTTTLGSTTTGATTLGATSVGGDLTILSAFRLLFGAAISKLVPGATSFSIRDTADANDNFIVTNAGAATVRNGLTVTAGGATVTAGGATITAGDATVTAGRLVMGAAAAKIVPGATSISHRNNADTADNLLITDAGVATLRSNLNLTQKFYALVHMSTNQNTPAGANTTSVVPFDTVDSDPNSNYDTVNHRYTVPQTGLYYVSARTEFQVNNSPQLNNIGIYVGGAETLRGQAFEANSGGVNTAYIEGLSVSGLVKLTSGNLVDARVFNIGTNAVTLDGGSAAITYFHIMYVSS